MYIKEQTKNIEVYDSVDVLVAGGGMSGCTAAIAAARAGARTMLIERNGCLGGVLTSNIIPNLLNNHLGENCEHLVSGVPRDIIDRLVARGGCIKDWDKPLAKIVFDEQKMKVVLIELLQEAGVPVLTHVLAAAPIMEDNIVRGLFIETKIGRRAIFAKVVIDCTGEADIVSQTGCPLRVTQGTASLAFKMSNFDGEKFYEHFKAHPDDFPKNHDGIRNFDDFALNWNEYGAFYFPHRGGREWPLVQRAIEKGLYAKAKDGAFGLDMMCLIGKKDLKDLSVNTMLMRLESLSPENISKAELESQKLCYYIADFMQKNLPGFADAHISQISQDMGIRVSRGIEGEKTLTLEEVTSPVPVYHDDVIGCRSARPWADDGNVDHPFDTDHEGKVASRSVNGETTPDGARFLLLHTVDLSYGIIVPRGVENILVGSGKTASCTPQTTMRCGTNSMRPAQGAGVSAAVAALDGSTTHTVDIKKVQKTLLNQGVYLGSSERLAGLGLTE